MSIVVIFNKFVTNIKNLLKFLSIIVTMHELIVIKRANVIKWKMIGEMQVKVMEKKNELIWERKHFNLIITGRVFESKERYLNSLKGESKEFNFLSKYELIVKTNSFGSLLKYQEEN